jgi:hypothetical protein
MGIGESMVTYLAAAALIFYLGLFIGYGRALKDEMRFRK